MAIRKKFREVQRMIIKFSRRDFSGPGSTRDDKEMLGAVIENLIMLGEELNESTVSKEYFQDIFNAVPDIILIMDGRGKIITCNNAMNSFISENEIRRNADSAFNNFFNLTGAKDSFSFFKKRLSGKTAVIDFKLKVRGDERKTFQCKFGRFRAGQKSGKYIALIKDITELQDYQEKIINSAVKYRQIFSGSSDGIFLMNKQGKIIEVNDALVQILKIKQKNTNPANFKEFVIPDEMKTASLLKLISQKGYITNMEVKVKTANNSLVDCLFSCVPVSEKNNFTGYQGVLKNISQYKEYNSMLMRSVGESQDNERKRIASDLHDSLGQQLSGIKFMLSSLIDTGEDERQKYFLRQMNADIYNLIEELRNICFDLMPTALERFGLIKPIEELINKLSGANNSIKFSFKHPKYFPRLKKEQEVNIYRIVQEFINNSIKYARCTQIQVLLSIDGKKQLRLKMKDNGRGFNPARLRKTTGGMGLRNIRSRVISFNGTLNIQSSPGKGTFFNIIIPFIHHEHN